MGSKIYLRGVENPAMNQTVFTPDAPEPIGPYSQAVWAGDLLFISGQIPIHPETKKLVSADIETETRLVMENIRAILQAAGLGFAQVVKCTIFLSDMAQFGTVNGVYGEYFTQNPPARETVEVARLPKSARVEISAIAYRG
jgi:2-iminobutanoate/2-iminopropanoate deaminase